jgi:mono/diheme cytochrome c family protein
MITLFMALLLLPLAQEPSAAPAGDPEAGKAVWQGRDTSCKNCHGMKGEGGFGPDLAGRKLTPAQFKHAVRQPWGIMPHFVESQISDKEIADFNAWFNSLPTNPEPAEWRFKMPDKPARGQDVAVSFGCAQCHGLELDTFPRHGAAEVNGDFEWFKHVVYEHAAGQVEQWKLTNSTPALRVRMGNFSRARLPEPMLLEIWNWLKDDLGFLAPVTARLSAGVPAADGVTYTLKVDSSAAKGKGVSAEDVTISLVVPAGTTVVRATGDGYKGTRKNDKAQDIAVWEVPRVAPQDHQAYTLTLRRWARAKPSTSRRRRPERAKPPRNRSAQLM